MGECVWGGIDTGSVCVGRIDTWECVCGEVLTHGRVCVGRY